MITRTSSNKGRQRRGFGKAVLPDNQLLRLLPRSASEVLLADATHVHLSRGDILFEPADEITHAIFLLTSTVASFVLSFSDGSSIEAATIGREGALGGIVSLGHKPAFCRAVVQIPGEALRVPMSTIEAAKTASPTAQHTIARYADCLISQVLQSVACATLHSIEARCARWLLTTHDRLRGEDLAERSLERMLIRNGALLLDQGEVEIDPSVSYRRYENNFPTLVSGPTGTPTVSSVDTVRDEYAASINVLVGLSLGLQGEISAGGVWARQENQLMVDNGTVDRVVLNDSGPQDIRVGLAKTLVREGQYTPDIIGRVGYSFPIGSSGGDVPLPRDSEAWDVSLVAVKRQDPMVFAGGVVFADPLENDGVEGGQTVSLFGNVYLAVSPETAIWFGARHSMSQEARVGGQDVLGSDAQVGTFEVGFSSVVAPKLSWDIALQLGLTDDAPTMGVAVTTPWRW